MLDLYTAYIQWDKWGYSVEIHDRNGRVVDGYVAGNHALDSQGHTENPDFMVSVEQLKEWAYQTAREMLSEYVSKDAVDSCIIEADWLREDY